LRDLTTSLFDFFLKYFEQVVNTKKTTLSSTTVEATVYDITGAIAYSTAWRSLTFEAKTTTSVGSVPLFTTINKQPMYFLLLKLQDSTRALVSRNFYWLHPTPGSYGQLAGHFRSTKIPVAVSAHATISGHTYKIRVQVANRNGNTGHTGATVVAFALQFSVVDRHSSGTDTRILPVTYSDNWFSLVPDETAVVDISFQVKKRTISPKLMLRGWNVADTEVTFTIG
jgi:mannosylglycoprotein endo-beta-mannosidase